MFLPVGRNIRAGLIQFGDLEHAVLAVAVLHGAHHTLNNGHRIYCTLATPGILPADLVALLVDTPLPPAG